MVPLAFFALAVVIAIALSGAAQNAPATGAVPSTETVKVGKVQGKVVDSTNGQPMIGTTVQLQDTKLGAVTDLDGNFTIRNVPVGTYTLVASAVGYATFKVTELTVTDANPATANILMSPQTLQLKNEITVKATRVKSGEAFLLKERQQSSTVSDAISAETISRSGGGNAATAMMRITGTSIADGKFAVIRGLSERYTNTRLNGSALPSADPDKQAFQMDLVPSDLLENIVVTKSYSVDQPGNFTGGSVNLVTKDFPEKRTFKLSSGVSDNSIVTGENIIASPSSGTDWIGHDNGLRDMPQFIKDNLDRIPKNNVIYRKPRNGNPGDYDKAVFLDSVSNAFKPQFNPITKTAPLNQNYAFSYGDNLPLFGRSLGLIANLTYNRSQSYYRNGDKNLYAPLTSTSLDPVNLLKDERGTDDVLWGGLASLHYSLATNHKIGARYVYNRNGNSETRFLSGVLNDYDPGQLYESHDNRYTERTLRSFQFNGDHQLKIGIPFRLDWQFSNAKTLQNEILQQFLYQLSVDSSAFPYDSIYGTNSSNLPAIYYRDIDETNRQFDLNLKIPMYKNGFLKFGHSYLRKLRTFRQTVFKYQIDNLTLLSQVKGNMDAFADSAGFSDTTGFFYGYNSYVYVFPTKTDEYDGSQRIPAWYGMLETPLFAPELKLVGGVRYEKTRMQAADLTTVHAGGKIFAENWLPSVSLTYAVTPSMNLRTVFSRTLARPNIREIAGFRSLDFAASKYFYGNPNLKYTQITNYDLRWEWFPRPGEIVAVSAFYKKFIDPIEIAYKVENYDRLPVNAPEAKNWGLEFEARKTLDQLSPALSDFTLGGNLTLVSSKVKVPADELFLMRILDPTAEDTRPMANQSPYLVNVSLGYDNKKSGSSVTLLYNVFGRRFYYNAQGGAPDIYEMPRHLVDLTFSQDLFQGLNFKFQARNLFNAHFEADYYYTGTGNKVVFEQHDLGHSFGFGLSAKIW